jgi:signal transduction histidine kinase
MRTQRQLTTIFCIVITMATGWYGLSEVLKQGKITLIAVLSAVNVILFAAITYGHWRGWRDGPKVLATIMVLTIIMSTPETYVTQHFPLGLLSPVVLALVSLTPHWVVSVAVIGYLGLLVRVGGQGILADPQTLINYSVLICGMTVARILHDDSRERTLRAAREAYRRNQIAQREVLRAMARTVEHNLIQPLTIIHGYAELMRAEATGEAAPDIEEIVQQTSRAVQLVRQISQIADEHQFSPEDELMGIDLTERDQR